MPIDRIVVHRRGVLALMQGPEIQADLRARAERIAAAAGPGMEADARVGRVRARASVVTATYAARRAEANGLALTRAVDAGR